MDIGKSTVATYIAVMILILAFLGLLFTTTLFPIWLSIPICVAIICISFSIK